MRKSEELRLPESCLNKAAGHELLFVLLERDPAAPMAIHLWAEERIRLGLNKADDGQIVHALALADSMDRGRAALRASLGKSPVIG